MARVGVAFTEASSHVEKGAGIQAVDNASASTADCISTAVTVHRDSGWASALGSVKEQAGYELNVAREAYGNHRLSVRACRPQGGA